jgi:membrane protease YdiL (CAAX protease family)
MTNVLIAAAALGSLVTLSALFQKHLDGRPLLEYEPRRPVPWNFLAPLVLLAPLAAVAFATAGSEWIEETTDRTERAASAAVGAAAGAPLGPSVGCALEAAAVEYADHRGNYAWQIRALWAQAATSLLLTLACYVLLVVGFGATPRDLGLPESWPQLRRDAGIGAVAFLAALLPTYLEQILLTLIFNPKHLHPLIEELNANPSPHMMIAAAVAAVVAAPIFEETSFRLIFQGWLERVEDAAIRVPTVEPDDFDVALTTIAPELAVAVHPPTPQEGRLLGLPRGWLPVLISGVLFALAHLGHGVAPGSLVLLGITLGYLYQRTHRIAPSIVCHMMFNGFSVVLLWLELSKSTQ